MNKILRIFLLFNYNKTESESIKMTKESESIKMTNGINSYNEFYLNKDEFDLLVNLDKKSKIVLISYGFFSFFNFVNFVNFVVLLAEWNNKILILLPNLMNFLTNSLLVFYKSYSIKIDLLFSLVIGWICGVCKDEVDVSVSMERINFGGLIFTKMFMYYFIYRQNSKRKEKINTLLSINSEKFKYLLD